MRKLLIFIIVFAGCNPVKQLERNVAKVERYKKALGVKPCECDEKVNQYRYPWWHGGIRRDSVKNVYYNTHLIDQNNLSKYSINNLDTTK